MEKFSALHALCEGNPEVIVVDSDKGDKYGALLFSFMLKIYAVEQTVERPVISDITTLIWLDCYVMQITVKCYFLSIDIVCTILCECRDRNDHDQLEIY